jgi:putative transcriptional regulator
MDFVTPMPKVRTDWRPLAATRHRLGLSQRELALAVGVHKYTIYRIEKGRSCPSVDLALGIARALGVPLHHLFTVSEVS